MNAGEVTRLQEAAVEQVLRIHDIEEAVAAVADLRGALGSRS